MHPRYQQAEQGRGNRREEIATGMYPSMRILADLIDPDVDDTAGSSITEADLLEETMMVLRLRGPRPPQLIPDDVLDALPPLYEWDVEAGDWRSHLGEYTAGQARAWVRREVGRCLPGAHNEVPGLRYWALHYAATRNEHAEDEGLPTAELMPDWEFIRATLDVLAEPSNTVLEKSRDMMASWMAMATVCHDVMFRRDWSVMTMSRVEDLVDDGGAASTVDCLHGKVRYVHENMPPFLRIPLEFKHLQIRNETTGASVHGFSTTMSAGRGPKYRRAVCDEFAWVPNSQQVMTSLHRACPRGKLALSTPNGKAGEFYRLRTVCKQVWPPHEDREKWERIMQYCDQMITKDVPNARVWGRVTIHWTMHPHRGDAWYELETDGGSMTAEAIAQELNISYEQSLVGRVYPKFQWDVHVAGGVYCPMRTADIDDERPLLTYDANRPLVLNCDFNHDPLVWNIVQLYPPDQIMFRVIGQILKRNAIFSDAVWEFIVRYASEDRLASIFARHPDYRRLYGQFGVGLAGPKGHEMEVLIYGDATEEKSTVYTRVRLYQAIRHLLEEEGGFTVGMHVPPSNPGIADRIETTNDAFKQRTPQLVVVDPAATELIKDCSNGVWGKGKKTADMDQTTVDDDGSGLTRSHASSAFGYMVMQKHKPRTRAGAHGRKQEQDVAALVRKWRN